MTQLSSDEAKKIIDGLLKAQEGLTNLPDTLDRTKKQGKQLHRQVMALGDEINKMAAIAINATGDELAEAVKGILDATDNANEAIERLDNIRKGIRIATALVNLGVAIASQNPGKILSAAKDVVDVARG